MYRALTFGGVKHRRMLKIWKSRIPSKLKVFLWLACQDKLKKGVALKKKKWKGEEKCLLCKVDETTDHILFQCKMASYVWTCIKEVAGMGKYPNFNEWFFFINWLPEGRHSYNVGLFYLACITWGLWKERNPRVIQKNFCRSPINVLHLIVVFMQRWRKTLRSQD